MKNLADNYVITMLADRYAEAWKTLDAELLFPLLSDDFTYGSMWVFEELGLDQFKDYLRGKFDTIRRTGAAPEVKVAVAENGDTCVWLNQNGNIAWIHLKEGNGKLTSAYMMAF